MGTMTIRRGALAAVGFILMLLPTATAAQMEADEDTSSATTAGFFFCKYKPNYFLLGVAETPEAPPTTKFQFSFRYVLWDFRAPKDAAGERAPQPENRCASPTSRHQVNFGYTQKSRWKLYEASAPFEENNYNPEVYYSFNTRDLLDWGPLDWVTTSIEHESNGEDDPISRSWNRVYWQLRLKWEDAFGTAPGGQHIGSDNLRQGWEARVYFRFWAIIPAGTDDNTDYGRNLGHFRLIAALSTPDYRFGSGSLDVEGTIGDAGDRGNVQVGLSYRPPIRGGWRFVPFLYAQYFGGYGETLVLADTQIHAFRLGLRLVR